MTTSQQQQQVATTTNDCKLTDRKYKHCYLDSVLFSISSSFAIFVDYNSFYCVYGVFPFVIRPMFAHQNWSILLVIFFYICSFLDYTHTHRLLDIIKNGWPIRYLIRPSISLPLSLVVHVLNWLDYIYIFFLVHSWNGRKCSSNIQCWKLFWHFWSGKSLQSLSTKSNLTRFINNIIIFNYLLATSQSRAGSRRRR